MGCCIPTREEHRTLNTHKPLLKNKKLIEKQPAPASNISQNKQTQIFKQKTTNYFTESKDEPNTQSTLNKSESIKETNKQQINNENLIFKQNKSNTNTQKPLMGKDPKQSVEPNTQSTLTMNTNKSESIKGTNKQQINNENLILKQNKSNTNTQKPLIGKDPKQSSSASNISQDKETQILKQKATNCFAENKDEPNIDKCDFLNRLT
eukprot:60014_1